jgi:hypothetical protein
MKDVEGLGGCDQGKALPGQNRCCGQRGVRWRGARAVTVHWHPFAPNPSAHVLRRCSYGSIFTILPNSSGVNALIVVVLTLPAIPRPSNCAMATSSPGPSAMAT